MRVLNVILYSLFLVPIHVQNAAAECCTCSVLEFKCLPGNIDGKLHCQAAGSPHHKCGGALTSYKCAQETSAPPDSNCNGKLAYAPCGDSGKEYVRCGPSVDAQFACAKVDLGEDVGVEELCAKPVAKPASGQTVF